LLSLDPAEENSLCWRPAPPDSQARPGLLPPRTIACRAPGPAWPPPTAQPGGRAPAGQPKDRRAWSFQDYDPEI